MFEINYKKILNWLMSLSVRKVLLAAIVSFVAASGISMYISYLMIPKEAPRPAVASRSRPSSIEVKKTLFGQESQKIILDRNIFNSKGELGDSDGSVDVSKARLPTGQLVKSDLPLELRGVIFAGDPFNGLAMIENTQKKRTQSFVVGDLVHENAKLTEVYDNRVILERDGIREYIELKKFELDRNRRKSNSPRIGTGFDRIATRPPPDSFREDGFERKGMDIKLTEEFKRSLLAPDNMTKVLQDAKAEPNMINGELRGFRLTRIREGSVYEKAGFQNGDVVEEINGIPLRDAAGAIRLLQQLKSAKDIEVRLKRGEISQDMTISIQ